MTLPAITVLPPPPTRNSDNATFVALADPFLAALVQLVTDINNWSAAVPGQVSPANFNTVSTTSVAVGTGAKSFTVETGKLLYVGQYLLIPSTASPANWMMGQVTSYNSSTGALVMNILTISGTGTFAAWTVGPAPVAGTSLNPRVITAGVTLGTITPDAAAADLYLMPGLTGAVTIAAPSGTPVQGQKLMLRIKDNGTSQTLTWNATYKPFGTVALPLSLIHI